MTLQRASKMLCFQHNHITSPRSSVWIERRPSKPFSGPKWEAADGSDRQSMVAVCRDFLSGHSIEPDAPKTGPRNRSRGLAGARSSP